MQQLPSTVRTTIIYYLVLVHRVALPDGYKSTRGDLVYCGGDLRLTEKPECERFVRPVVVFPPHFFVLFCVFSLFSPGTRKSLAFLCNLMALPVR